MDIQSQTDIRRVVDAFYNGIDEDPVIGRYFAGLDMSRHLPRMYAFWGSVVFQTGTYHGRPFDAHVKLDGLHPDHFSRWLQRFEATIDPLYSGEKAEHMKERARQIGAVFQIKLGLEPVILP